jgi:2,3-bisphosphoglycerate-dependent phosphoglycerate mutase
MSNNLVLVRHGQSLWNRGRRFTGWSDVPLTPQGRDEARAVGELLRTQGLEFDLAYTSVLERATETLRIVLELLGLEGIPVQRSWRLNERHYGAIQGMSRPEVARRYGWKQLVAWQSGYDNRPPAVSLEDERYPRHDARYDELPDSLLPRTESLKDTLERVLPYWSDTIEPQIHAGRRVLVVAHKTSLRALRKHLDGISDADIAGLTIRTGEPVIYNLDARGHSLGHNSLRPSGLIKRYVQVGLGKWIQPAAAKGRK